MSDIGVMSHILPYLRPTPHGPSAPFHTLQHLTNAEAGQLCCFSPTNLANAFLFAVNQSDPCSVDQPSNPSRPRTLCDRSRPQPGDITWRVPPPRRSTSPPSKRGKRLSVKNSPRLLNRKRSPNLLHAMPAVLSYSPLSIASKSRRWKGQTLAPSLQRSQPTALRLLLNTLPRFLRPNSRCATTPPAKRPRICSMRRVGALRNLEVAADLISQGPTDGNSRRRIPPIPRRTCRSMAPIVFLGVSLIRNVSRAPTTDRCAPERLCRASWDCSRTETGAALPH